MLLHCWEVKELGQGKATLKEDTLRIGRSVCQQSLFLKSFNHPLNQRGFPAFFLLSSRVTIDKSLKLPKPIKILSCYQRWINSPLKVATYG